MCLYEYTPVSSYSPVTTGGSYSAFIIIYFHPCFAVKRGEENLKILMSQWLREPFRKFL